MPDENTEVIKLEHKLSKSFTSCYATGAILNHSDSLWQIMFYVDSAYTKNEQITLTNGKQEHPSTVEVISFREDQARISLTPETARSLYDLLGAHLTNVD